MQVCMFFESTKFQPKSYLAQTFSNRAYSVKCVSSELLRACLIWSSTKYLSTHTAKPGEQNTPSMRGLRSCSYFLFLVSYFIFSSSSAAISYFLYIISLFLFFTSFHTSYLSFCLNNRNLRFVNFTLESA